MKKLDFKIEKDSNYSDFLPKAFEPYVDRKKNDYMRYLIS